MMGSRQFHVQQCLPVFAGGSAGWMPVHSCWCAQAGLDHQLPVPLCHLWIYDWSICHHWALTGTATAWQVTPVQQLIAVTAFDCYDCC